jgi:hypothetical protein
MSRKPSDEQWERTLNVLFHFCPEVIGERVGDKIAAILTALQYAMR